MYAQSGKTALLFETASMEFNVHASLSTLDRLMLPRR